MQYSEAVWVPFLVQGSMIATSLLASDLNGIIRTAETTGSVPPTDRYPQTITTTNILAPDVGAADTAVDETCQWIPEVSGTLDKLFINICAMANMTAWTDNQNVWDTTRITITRVGGTDIILDSTYVNGTSMGAVSHHLHIVADSIRLPGIKVRAGQQLDIRVRTTNTKTITNVTSWGIVPFFPQQIPGKAADPLFWAHSGIMFYITRDRK